MTEKWDSILKEAISRLETGDIDGAIRLCDEVINWQENSIPKKIRAIFFCIRGDAYAKKGDLDRAIYDYGEAIKLDPECMAAFYNRGNTYAKKGDLDRAISDFNEAIDLDFKNAAAFYNRGNAYQEKGDFDHAISDFDDAINLDPKNAVMFNNRGNAYQKKGDLERAISDYDEAIKLDPNYAVAFYNRGNTYAKKGDLDRAISDYDKAIKLDPKNAVAFYNRGNIYKDKGDLDRAISDFDEAIKLDPKFTAAFHNRAIAFGRLNAQADEKKFREEHERGLQKVREQSEQETKKLREQLRQASEQSERDAEKLREQLRQVSKQFRQVSTPAEIIAKYEEREGEYKKRIEELAGEIKTFARNLQIGLIFGLIGRLVDCLGDLEVRQQTARLRARPHADIADAGLAGGQLSGVDSAKRHAPKKAQNGNLRRRLLPQIDPLTLHAGFR